MCGCRGGSGGGMPRTTATRGVRNIGRSPRYVDARVIVAHAGREVGSLLRVDEWEFAQLHKRKLVEVANADAEEVRGTGGA